jgi:hypothetical protein
MFCPKCGKSDQQVNSFCRNCGTFLPDFDKIKSKEISPEQHLTANSALNIMTAVASLSLAITLYVIFWGKENTPFIIYLTAGFLTAMFFWQAQVFWRNMMLKKTLKNNKPTIETTEEQSIVKSETTAKLLDQPDLSDFVPASVAEQTTKNLTKQSRH